ncbi:MAG: pyridoxal-dependent decarboxylase [Gammaproteobacteria bacterium]|nr:pyridoxal-dependent decarboxylase [Gammaproteobacteria bacterium]MDH5345058.1 pyridoxal-dependent decarboxylase [Gammaproteobacteria bacterium]
MTRFWKKKNDDELRARVFAALKKNVNYYEQNVFGVPASQLDEKVFYRDASFLKDAPFLSTLMENPNHIGCHTLDSSEPFFGGTQEIERELIEICACDILSGQPGQQDGYVASGGTEANLQAAWIYRNLFRSDYGATDDEICILCSADSHYSVNKAANILSIDIAKVPVDDTTRIAGNGDIAETITRLASAGKKYFIVVVNMMTTMFGSVDRTEGYVSALRKASAAFRIHVDGAYGGFYYPFAGGEPVLDFSNPDISSVTLDAHKMLQAPYGTGIFLARKGLMRYVLTTAARYVEGQDYTLIGSRSGANAIAVWMILMKNGPQGWREKILVLQKRTQWLCDQLAEAGIEHYRHPASNIVAIRANAIDHEVAKAHWLVPDDHDDPDWYKIVVMEHVTIEKLEPFINALTGA